MSEDGAVHIKYNIIICHVSVMMDIPWTQALYNACKQTLFQVICDVWAKQDGLMVMTIWATNNIQGSHILLDRSKDLLERCVEELTPNVQ